MSSITDSTALTLLPIISTIYFLTVHIFALSLHIDHFYSHSFIPDALKIDYEVVRHVSIYYNVTAFRPFPGQLLMNLFIRRYNAVKGKPSDDIFKQRNIDFCKTLDLLRNVTNDANARDFLLQDTFVTSCPLVNGFYYIQNGTIPNNIVPWFIKRGRYIVNFELIQVVDELVKLMNLRFVLIVDKDVEYKTGYGNGNDNDGDNDSDNDNDDDSDGDNRNEDDNDNEDEHDDDNNSDNNNHSDNDNGNDNDNSNGNNDNEDDNDSDSNNDNGNDNDNSNDNGNDKDNGNDSGNDNDKDNGNDNDNRNDIDSDNDNDNDNSSDNNNDKGNSNCNDNDNGSDKHNDNDNDNNNGNDTDNNNDDDNENDDYENK